MTWSRVRNVATIALCVAVAFGAGSSAVLAARTDAVVSISALTAVEGSVLIGRAGARFAPGREGDVIAAGDTIRTGPDASAEVTYFDGSTVRLDAGAEIVVTSLRTSEDVVGQTLGRAWRAATKIVSGSSRYETRGPSSTAAVRG